MANAKIAARGLAERPYVDSVGPHATGRRNQDARDQVQQRRLPASARADHRNRRATSHGQLGHAQPKVAMPVFKLEVCDSDHRDI